MVARGLLRFATHKGRRIWIVTDEQRVNAQSRRLDGNPWPDIGAKAKTLPGARAAHPIGTPVAARFPVVLICEGGPDLLAAHHFIHAHQRDGDAAAVGMLGASLRIPRESLPSFAGKRVRVFAHADEAGRNAAMRWVRQLESIGARTDAADLRGLFMDDGKTVKDLNDLTRLRPDQLDEINDLIPSP